MFSTLKAMWTQINTVKVNYITELKDKDTEAIEKTIVVSLSKLNSVYKYIALVIDKATKEPKFYYPVEFRVLGEYPAFVENKKDTVYCKEVNMINDYLFGKLRDFVN